MNMRIGFSCGFVCLAGTSLLAQPTVTSVVNAFSFQPSLAPGGYAAVYGSNLGTEPSAHVTVGGKAAFVMAATNGQFNIQIPLDAPLGNTSLTIATNAGTSP